MNAITNPDVMPNAMPILSLPEFEPFGTEIMRPMEETVDLGTLACVQNLSSTNDDASGVNDDYLYEQGTLDNRPGSILSLN
ncbi:MAG: hypothetical protein ABWX94_02235 [Candidatus Saccharimonadales bacterium]